MLTLAWGMGSVAQQGGAVGEPIVVRTSSLPRAYLRQRFEAHLEAEGGILPLRWEVSSGNLPQGLALGRDGALSGTAAETGVFHFTVTVSDSGRPASQRSKDLTLTVVAPLLADWRRYPQVDGDRIEGSIVVSNQTEQDFDLTVIVLAVDDGTHRATAIGYQHFSLKKDTTDLEIPFGESLPPGSYEVSADVVAEAADINAIYRARLVAKEKLQIVAGP